MAEGGRIVWAARQSAAGDGDFIVLIQALCYALRPVASFLRALRTKATRQLAHVYGHPAGVFVVAKVDQHCEPCVEASTRHELDVALKPFMEPVPPLGNGLTKVHVEDWAIGRLLRTLAGSEPFTFPMAVHRRERPDFALVTGCCSVGVEVTQAVPEDLAQISAIEWSEDIDRVRGFRLFRPGVSLTAADTKRAARLNDPEVLMPSDECILSNWVDAMRWSIEKKTGKFDGYSTYDHNLLLIDDEWPSHGLTEMRALERLGQTLDWHAIPYDDVLIDRCRTDRLLSCRQGWRMNVKGRNDDNA